MTDPSAIKDVSDVVLFILNADERALTVITAAVQNRRQTLNDTKSLMNQASIYVGDRVRLVSDVRPKKIAGKFGTVVDIKEDGKFKVKLEVPVDKWMAPVCEPYMVEKVS